MRIINMTFSSSLIIASSELYILSAILISQLIIIYSNEQSEYLTSGIMYGIGRRMVKNLSDEVKRTAATLSDMTGFVFDGPGALHGVWTLEGIDWMTGTSVIHEVIGWSPALNSLYAATEIGPGSVHIFVSYLSWILLYLHSRYRYPITYPIE